MEFKTIFSNGRELKFWPVVAWFSPCSHHHSAIGCTSAHLADKVLKDFSKAPAEGLAVGSGVPPLVCCGVQCYSVHKYWGVDAFLLKCKAAKTGPS